MERCDPRVRQQPSSSDPASAATSERRPRPWHKPQEGKDAGAALVAAGAAEAAAASPGAAKEAAKGAAKGATKGQDEGSASVAEALVAAVATSAPDRPPPRTRSEAEARPKPHAAPQLKQAAADDFFGVSPSLQAKALVAAAAPKPGTPAFRRAAAKLTDSLSPEEIRRRLMIAGHQALQGAQVTTTGVFFCASSHAIYAGCYS